MRREGVVFWAEAQEMENKAKERQRKRGSQHEAQVA